MSSLFFEQPILNPPYLIPTRHWELDKDGQPTQKIIEERRPSSHITPIPKPQKRVIQQGLGFTDNLGLSTEAQKYRLSEMINVIRRNVADWRALPRQKWNVTPETARLLQHWRHHPFAGMRPFFCQVEAAETAIWLTEVAPHSKSGRDLLNHVGQASEEANPGIERIALKLATGAGKTTVMAMLIAWQAVNAAARPGAKLFTRGFLVVTPGITIKDRLRVLQPNDPDSYYRQRELVPQDMIGAVLQAKIVITNYHAFQLREQVEVSKIGRELLRGRGPEVQTTETPGQMLRRVMPDLMGMKKILVLNDEAHHCYREKPVSEEQELKGDDRKEAEDNNAKARLWISGLEMAKQIMGLRVLDLSATPFFLRGSGYAEGTMFPWTVSDFSLMDAIECGIVKLPRVPVAENIPGKEMPVYRELWVNIRSDMPKKGRGQTEFDPLKLPTKLQTALDALYGHYKKGFDLWAAKEISVPPCFIIVCQNTAISKLIYDYVSGFYRTETDKSSTIVHGKLPLFRNFDTETGEPLARPRTLLIDSKQLEAGDALDESFRRAAADEIERFRREIVERTGDRQKAEQITDQALLREVMNTVGKPGQLGGSIRCVVSVSMLTEGWDANTVTHVLGVRAFGTQLLCEQVIGRALRRQSYELNERGLFNVEYADVFGIPFDFTAKPIIAPPQAPRETIQVRAVRPDRDALEITFPRVEGYRVELPKEQIDAVFDADSTLILSPDLVGPSITRNSGIIGEGVDLSLQHLDQVREATVVYHLTQRLLLHHWRDEGQPPKIHLFGQMKRVVQRWMGAHLRCVGATFPAQLLYLELADRACSRISAAITASLIGDRPVIAQVNAYNPVGSTRSVQFNTSATHRWKPAADRCHINWIILDSDWEAEFCRVADGHPRVRAYVKNHSLGFEVPYLCGAEQRMYRPDFIALVDDGQADLLHLVVEIKGYRREDAKEKRQTMERYWVPGVNQLRSYGRWAFLELTDIHQIQQHFTDFLEGRPRRASGIFGMEEGAV